MKCYNTFLNPLHILFVALDNYHCKYFFWMNTNFYRYFSENPKPMFDLIKELYLDHNPTLTHYFIALLEKKGLLLRVYTQNVDALGSKLSKISSFFYYFHAVCYLFELFFKLEIFISLDLYFKFIFLQ